MVQLKGDCFAFPGGLILLDDALAELDKRVSCTVGMHNVPVDEAEGRILAENVTSERDVPPHPNTAVDGYAFRFADLMGRPPHELSVSGKAGAGHPLKTPPKRGTAVRVLTGALLPKGTDTVVMEEDVEARETSVLVPEGLRKGSNARAAGEDVKAGVTVLQNGTQLGPAEIGILSAIGRTDVEVRRRLRVALLSSGDELVDPRKTPKPGQVYDSNRPMIHSLLARAGAEVSDLGILRDEVKTVRTALMEAAPTHDLLVASGGMSASEEDHVRRVVDEEGSLDFWRLAVRPGRPVGFGTIGNTPIIGLPGNPVAAFVTFVIIARPLIALLAGEKRSIAKPVAVASGFSCRKKQGRREFLRARLNMHDGKLALQRFAKDGAGILSSVVWADGLAVLEEDTTEVRHGELVGFLPLAGLIN